MRAESVTKRSFASMVKSSSVVSLLLSTTSVTKLFASLSGASDLILLPDTRKISKFLHCAKLAGKLTRSLFSASRTFKFFNLPMLSGSSTKPLPLMMSVSKPVIRLMSGESLVNESPSLSFKLLTLLM